MSKKSVRDGPRWRTPTTLKRDQLPRGLATQAVRAVLQDPAVVEAPASGGTPEVRCGES